MKNCYSMNNHIESRFDKLIRFDMEEIDNPDRFNTWRLYYMNRINKIISLIKILLPYSNGKVIGDLACAQCNVGLSLAEIGYKVVAMDIDSNMLDYAKLKYEKGEIEWVNSNIGESNLQKNSFDAIVLGEVVEHCAFPEKIVKKAFDYLKEGGFLIITTPNGSRIRKKIYLSSFKKTIYLDKTRGNLEKRQFGPSGEDHLFLLRPEELKLIIPENSKIVNKGYLGGTFLINSISIKLLKKITPFQFVEKIIDLVNKVPIINRYTCNNLFIVIRK